MFICKHLNADTKAQFQYHVTKNEIEWNSNKRSNSNFANTSSINNLSKPAVKESNNQVYLCETSDY